VPTIKDEPLSEEFPPLTLEPTDPQAGVLLLPGLNLKSESLNEIANEFSARGFKSKIVNLTKPFDDSSLASDELAQIWMTEAREGYRVLAASMPGRPNIIFGYSLGALLAIDLVLDGGTSAEVFLLAPPIKLGFSPSLLLTATQLLPANYQISSRASEHYRRAPWSLAVEYQALQELRGRVQSQLENAIRDSLSGAAIISVRDELVSANKVADSLAKTDSGLEVTLLDLPTNSFNHLIIDRSSLRNDGWQLLIAAIEKSVARVLNQR